MLVYTKNPAATGGELELEQCELSAARELTPPGASATIDQAPWPHLFPVEGTDSAAALIVPPHWHRRIERNGVPLSSGVHALQHADRVDIAPHSYWIAARQTVQTTAYDPAVHGDDMYCLLTKTRLQTGEAIVACPGRPGVPCDARYRQSAWQMALESNARFVCLRCRFDPNESEWRPPLRPASPLPRLFELAARRQPGAAP